MNKPVILRVRSDTDVNNLATAILGELSKHSHVRCTGLGAGPINQIIKAVGRARILVQDSPYDICAIPEFSDESPPGVVPAWVRVTIIAARISRDALSIHDNPATEGNGGTRG